MPPFLLPSQNLRLELHHLLPWNCNHLSGIKAHRAPWLPLLYHKGTKAPQKHVFLIFQRIRDGIKYRVQELIALR